MRFTPKTRIRHKISWLFRGIPPGGSFGAPSPKSPAAGYSPRALAESFSLRRPYRGFGLRRVLRQDRPVVLRTAFLLFASGGRDLPPGRGHWGKPPDPNTLRGLLQRALASGGPTGGSASGGSLRPGRGLCPADGFLFFFCWGHFPPDPHYAFSGIPAEGFLGGNPRTPNMPSAGLLRRAFRLQRGSSRRVGLRRFLRKAHRGIASPGPPALSSFFVYWGLFPPTPPPLGVPPRPPFRGKPPGPQYASGRQGLFYFICWGCAPDPLFWGRFPQTPFFLFYLL